MPGLPRLPRRSLIALSVALSYILIGMSLEANMEFHCTCMNTPGTHIVLLPVDSRLQGREEELRDYLTQASAMFRNHTFELAAPISLSNNSAIDAHQSPQCMVYLRVSDSLGQNDAYAHGTRGGRVVIEVSGDVGRGALQHEIRHVIAGHLCIAKLYGAEISATVRLAYDFLIQVVSINNFFRRLQVAI